MRTGKFNQSRMNKLVIALFTLIIFNACSDGIKDRCTVNVEAISCSGCKVEISYSDPLYFEQFSLKTIYLDSNGLAKIDLDVKEVSTLILTIQDSTTFPFLIQNGEDLEIKIQDSDRLLKYAGSFSEINYVFRQINELYTKHEFSDGKHLLDLNLSQFFLQIEQFQNHANALLKDNPSLSNTQVGVLQQFIKVRALMISYNYALMKYSFYSNEKIPKQVLEIQDLPNDNNLVKIAPFFYGVLAYQYLEMKIYPKVWSNNGDENSIELSWLRADSMIRTKHYKKEVESLLRAINIKNQVEKSHDYTISRKLFLDYQQQGGSDAYLGKLSSMLSSKAELSKGKKAPNIVGYDVEGKRLELKDLLGYTLVVDVWATWCGPCIQSMPKMKKLEKKLSGRNVRFVYLSVDEQVDKWKKYSEAHLTEHISILDDEESSIYQNYLIAGIPRYIVIDDEGLIVDAIAPPPGSGELENIILESAK